MEDYFPQAHIGRSSSHKYTMEDLLPTKRIAGKIRTNPRSTINTHLRHAVTRTKTTLTIVEIKRIKPVDCISQNIYNNITYENGNQNRLLDHTTNLKDEKERRITIGWYLRRYGKRVTNQTSIDSLETFAFPLILNRVEPLLRS